MSSTGPALAKRGAIERLWKDLVESRIAPHGAHLSADELDRYVARGLAAGTEERVLRHVESCYECTLAMERRLSDETPLRLEPEGMRLAGKPSESSRHAVVAGGSLGGMLAARVLAEHFDRVTVVARTSLTGVSENRFGVPHARHPHVVTERGLSVIEELFPGICAEFLAAGTRFLDHGSDSRILYRSGWAPQTKLGIGWCTLTRPLLVEMIRRRLNTDPKISLLEGFGVTGLVVREDRVRGVTIVSLDPDAPVAKATTLSAELVVDASGWDTQAPEWLEAAGYAKPEETIVDAYWGFAARIYKPAGDFDRTLWKRLVIMHRPPYQPRAGSIQPIEDDRWLVTLYGVMHDYPPTSEEGFLTFARSLSSPELSRAIEQGRPLSRIWASRRTENRRRHFERANVPRGFVAIGGAVCAVNPVHGAGMTYTVREVQELRRSLSESGGELDGRRLQQRIAKLVNGPWTRAVIEDLRWPATQGGKLTLKVRLMQWYIEQVVRLIPRSPEIFRRFQEVDDGIAGSAALYHPAVLVRVLRKAFAPRRRGIAPWDPSPQPAVAAAARRRSQSSSPEP